MDLSTELHLMTWLEAKVPAVDRKDVQADIRRIVADHPDLLARGDSWPEIRRLAERSLTQNQQRR